MEALADLFCVFTACRAALTNKRDINVHIEKSGLIRLYFQTVNLSIGGVGFGLLPKR
jgi:hypothetical protein